MTKNLYQYFGAAALIAIFSVCAFAQLNLPRDSQRQTISQVVGDTTVSIVYHRPNVKGRKVWGGLVPYGEVWRAGANENTVFETSRDITVNGQPLPAGKYGFHVLPAASEWTLIFNKVNDAWGSFTYDQKNDQLRVAVKPVTAPFHESLTYGFDNITANTAQISLAWENLAAPFTISVGDLSGRTLTMIRDAVKNRKADDVRPLNQGANYILANKQTANYDEALGWINESIKTRETFGNLQTKARILAESGKFAEAVSVGDKAVQIGKAATPAANTTDLEKSLAEWKSKSK